MTKIVSGKKLNLHIILLDNRYSYNKAQKDKLGADQWQWLDLALKRGKNYEPHFTIIAAGI